MRLHRLAPVVLIVVLAACRPPAVEVDVAGAREDAVVYGVDGRVDVYASDAGFASVADSLVAQIEVGALSFTPQGTVLVSAPTLGDEYGLCDDERFVDQPTAGFCSGTLIDDDLVLTAGHCLDGFSCSSFAFVFDYLYRTPAQTFSISFNDDVYFCDEVVVLENDDALDFAVVRLDRAVAAVHPPVPVRRELEPVTAGSPILLAGFPSGLPAKLDDTGTILNPRAAALDYFTGTPDSFHGNSGSAILDEDNVIVGILVRGEEDYAWDPVAQCTRVDVLDDDGSDGFEEMTYAARAIEALCASGAETSLCDTGVEVCAPCGPGASCPDGTQCLSWGDNPAISFCAPTCGGNTPCPSGHECSALGLCTPERAPACVMGDVWDVDSCGQSIVKTSECGDAICVDGSCQTSGNGDTCATAIAISPVTQTITGSLIGFNNAGGGSCGNTGPDRIYAFTLQVTSSFIATASGFDTLLHLRRVCSDPDTEVACDDDSGPGTNARLELTLSPGSYALYMDSWSSSVGTYSLDLTFAPLCGDGCAPGTTTCSGVDVRTCVVDEMGCAALGPPTPCGGEEVCVDGACTVSCDDECEVLGELVCLDAHRRASCEHLDGSSCLTLVEIDACPPDLMCADGFCEGCPTACEPGETRCFSSSVRQTCVDPNGDGCFTWGENTLCPDESICTNGACVSSCEDPCEVGTRGCVDADTETVCVLGRSDCPAVVESACPLGSQCVDGVGCVDECPPPCTVGERRCGAAGDVERCAVDGDGCAVFASVATCPDGTACEGGFCAGTCVSVCTPGDARCVGVDRVEECTDDVAACAVWTAPARCAGGVACVDGRCDGPCIVACTPGVAKCASAHAATICRVTELGCSYWEDPRYCFGDDVCSDGACGPGPDGGVVDAGPLDGPAPSARPSRVTIAPLGGCAATTRSDGGLVVALLALLACARRRRRA